MVWLWTIAGGCGDVRRSGGGGDRADGGGASDVDGAMQLFFSVAVSPARVMVRQDGSADVEVTVEREAGFDDPIAVAIDGLPAGVTAEPLEIGAGETSGTIAVRAEAGSAQGALDLSVTGTAGDVNGSAALRLLVAGPPGTLDLSFADGGRLTYQLDGQPSVGSAILAQADGRIVVAGSAASRALIVRLGPDGALDDSFGDGGAVSIGVGDQGGGGPIIERYGRILVGGFAGTGDGNYDMAVFALTADGTPDPAFGTGGIVVSDTPFPAGNVRKLVVDAEERIIAVGSVTDFATEGLEVLRFSPAGAEDPVYRISADNFSPRSAILDAGGRLVIAGSLFDGTQLDFCVARYLPDGTPDPSFDGDGTAVVPVKENDVAVAVTEQAGGKLLVAGSVLASDSDSAGLARLDPDGSPDGDFGPGGAQIPTTGIHVFDATFDPAGDVIATGYALPPLTTQPVAARFRADGTPDETFGDGAIATLGFPAEIVGPSPGVSGAAVDADGRILLVGQVGPDADYAVAVARLWP